jgi:hypothetical protein
VRRQLGQRGVEIGVDDARRAGQGMMIA